MNLEINVKSLYLVVANGPKWEVKYKNVDEKYFVVNQTDNQFSIEQIEHISSSIMESFLFSNQSYVPAIEVYVPEKINIANIKANSGKIDIHNLVFNQLMVNLKNGKIDVSNIKADDAKIKCINGVCECDQIKIINNLKLKVCNGSANLFNSLSDECGYEVRCKLGLISFYGKNSFKLLQKDGNPMHKVACINGKCVIK